MDEPVDTAAVAAHLKAKQGLGSTDIPSAHHSTWLDNARAKLDLNWRPRTDLAKLIDAAGAYKRSPTIPGRSGIRVDGEKSDRMARKESARRKARSTLTFPA